LAFGAWKGVTITRAPSERTTSSNDRLNFVSRSRMRNRTGLARASRSGARFPAGSGDPAPSRAAATPGRISRIQADAVGSYPLYERCGIENECGGRRRCPLI
jgi:hypothetical protein